MVSEIVKRWGRGLGSKSRVLVSLLHSVILHFDCLFDMCGLNRFENWSCQRVGIRLTGCSYTVICVASGMSCMQLVSAELCWERKDGAFNCV